jgi:alkaline phosphatase D
VNENHLQRPDAGRDCGKRGALKNGKTAMTNITNNTLTGKYSVQNVAAFGYNQSFNPSA